MFFQVSVYLCCLLDIYCTYVFLFYFQEWYRLSLVHWPSHLFFILVTYVYLVSCGCLHNHVMGRIYASVLVLVLWTLLNTLIQKAYHRSSSKHKVSLLLMGYLYSIVHVTYCYVVYSQHGICICIFIIYLFNASFTEYFYLR